MVIQYRKLKNKENWKKGVSTGFLIVSVKHRLGGSIPSAPTKLMQ